MSDLTRQFTWLHLSDIHIKGGDPKKSGDPYDRDRVLDSLIREVKRLRENGRQVPNAIFVTGDVAHGGKTDEYEQATVLFDELLAAAGLDKSHLFVIRGNHDVDRDEGKYLLRTLGSVSISDGYFSPAETKPHFAKFKAFNAWHNKYFAGVRQIAENTTCEPLEYLSYNGLKVVIAAINSALFCQDDNDHNKLWVGRRCLENVIDELDKQEAEIRIALIHHPVDWLHDGERSAIKALISHNFDIVLSGHLHEEQAESISTPLSKTLRIASGATYQGSQWHNLCLYGTADYDNGKVSLYPIEYRDIPNRKWSFATSIFPDEVENIGIYEVEWKSEPSSQRRRRDISTSDQSLTQNADTDISEAASELIAILQSIGQSGLLPRLFPQSHKQLANGNIQSFINDLPEYNIYRLIDRLKPFINNDLHGKHIWPNDDSVAQKIDAVMHALLFLSDMALASRLGAKMDIASLAAVVNALSENHPQDARVFLREVGNSYPFNPNPVFLTTNPISLALANIAAPESKAADIAAKSVFSCENTSEEEKFKVLLKISKEDAAEFLEKELSDALMEEVVNAKSVSNIDEDLSSLGMYGYPIINEVNLDTFVVEVENDYEGQRLVINGDINVGFSSNHDYDSYEKWYNFPGELKAYYDSDGLHIESVSVDTTSWLDGDVDEHEEPFNV